MVSPTLVALPPPEGFFAITLSVLILVTAPELFTFHQHDVSQVTVATSARLVVERLSLPSEEALLAALAVHTLRVILAVGTDRAASYVPLCVHADPFSTCVVGTIFTVTITLTLLTLEILTR